MTQEIQLTEPQSKKELSVVENVTKEGKSIITLKNENNEKLASIECERRDFIGKDVFDKILPGLYISKFEYTESFFQTPAYVDFLKKVATKVNCGFVVREGGYLVPYQYKYVWFQYNDNQKHILPEIFTNATPYGEGELMVYLDSDV